MSEPSLQYQHMKTWNELLDCLVKLNKNAPDSFAFYTAKVRAHFEILSALLSVALKS